jgi:ubiquinone/menaquinone biosynthesis C-methylase UbiE
MKRLVRPELLDSDAALPVEVQQTLSDLRRINRWFGGISTTRRMLEKAIARGGCHTLVGAGEASPERRARRRGPTGRSFLAHVPSLSLLDVGAGSGDVSLAAARKIGSQAQIRVTLLDRIASHLPRNGVGTVAGNALALPFRDASFDFVTCSLLVHHLERPEIVRFVNEALRVARVAVLLNDLRREPLHLALVYAGFPLFSRVTRHDGVASVRRAYTPEEMRSILRDTDAACVEIDNHYLYRMGVVAWKRGAP